MQIQNYAEQRLTFKKIETVFFGLFYFLFTRSCGRVDGAV